MAEEHGLPSIAFPSISTGAYGFPLQSAARTALREIRGLPARNRPLEQVVVVCFSRRTYGVYAGEVKELRRPARRGGRA